MAKPSGDLIRSVIPAIALGLGLALGGCMSAAPGGQPEDAANHAQAIASPLRTDQDRRADASRKPAEFLRFARARPGMKVLDVAAGAGYTAQLLALAVGPGGTVWAQVHEPSPSLAKRLADHPQPNLVPVVRSFEDPVPDGTPKLDLITIVLNYHDIAYMPVDRLKMDRRLFDALKPGGYLVLIDHSAMAGTGITAAKSLHRIDQAVVMDELRQAGFRLDEESDFLRNPADPRDKAFFAAPIVTDKFALRFAKP